MGAPEAHRHDAPKGLRYYVVTVSTRRYRDVQWKESVSDESGDAAQTLIEGNKGIVSGRKLIPDDAGQLRSTLQDAVGDEITDVVVFTGGTGVSTTDVTIETVRPFFEKEIEGFGELFRSVSYQTIG